MFFNNDDIVDQEFFAYMVEQDVPFDYAGLSLPYAKPDWLPAGWTRQQYFTQLSKTIDFIGLLDKRVLICEGSYNHYQ